MSPLVRSAPRRFAGMVLAGALTTSVLVLLPATFATAATPAPDGTLTGSFTTSPFAGTSVRMDDNEASAYVKRDDALWLAEDFDGGTIDKKRVFETDATTGTLRRSITSGQLASAAPVVPGLPALTAANYRDIESIAYDANADVLYVLSGLNDPQVNVPTIFRLTRQNGSLQVQDYRLLPVDADYTAAAWNPGDGKLYVGYKKWVRTYDFATGVPGPELNLNVSQVYGMDFSPDGSELFVSRTVRDSTTKQPTTAEVVDLAWPAKTVSWRLNVLPQAKDPRAVAYVDGALYVSDGYDDLSNPTTEHAVYVFGQRQSTPMVEARFTPSATSGRAPLEVTFQDASTGSPTRWSWEFGDGSTSTERNPTHTFATPGTYHVKLTASSLTRSGQATATIEVKDETAPTGTYAVPGGKVWAKWTKLTLSQTALHDDFTPAAQIQRRVSWGDGTTSTDLSHVYRRAGSFRATVTLTDNAGNAATVEAGTVVVAADTTAPVVTLKRPSRATSVRSWRTLRGTAVDAATKVHDVRIRVIEKRGTRWYAYRATTRSWVPARSRAAAMRISRPAVLAPRTTTWAYRVPGLRKGYLLTTVTGRDMLGNRSAAKTYAQLITRR